MADLLEQQTPINENDHIGLIYEVAIDLANNDPFCRRRIGSDIGEYIGYGYIGLRHAIKNYRPEKGEWLNYAWAVIKDTILKYARRTTLVKIADGARYQAWRAINGKPKSNRISDKSVAAARAWMERQVVPVNGLKDEHNVGMRDPMPMWEINDTISHALRGLDKRKRSVIMLRYGINGPKRTLQEVGEILGVTRERVRQIEIEALKEMRETLS